MNARRRAREGEPQVTKNVEGVPEGQILREVEKIWPRLWALRNPF